MIYKVKRAFLLLFHIVYNSTTFLFPQPPEVERTCLNIHACFSQYKIKSHLRMCCCVVHPSVSHRQRRRESPSRFLNSRWFYRLARRQTRDDRNERGRETDLIFSLNIKKEIIQNIFISADICEGKKSNLVIRSENSCIEQFSLDWSSFHSWYYETAGGGPALEIEAIFFLWEVIS